MTENSLSKQATSFPFHFSCHLLSNILFTLGFPSTQPSADKWVPTTWTGVNHMEIMVTTGRSRGRGKELEGEDVQKGLKGKKGHKGP